MSATSSRNSKQRKTRCLAKALLVSILALGLGPVAMVHASPVAYTLYGTSTGWGFTASTITSPGPDLTATPGEIVEVTLYAADSNRHNFYIDYNGNALPDPDEPVSPNFGREFPSPITFTFTASTTPGTYAYICDYHSNNQYGRFILGVPPPPVVSANLVGRSAWPEHHHFSLTGDEDGMQTLFGKVQNLGTVSTVVRVTFDIHNATTEEHIETVSTVTMLLTPGQTSSPPLSVTWAPPSTGKYMIEARAWFDSDGDGAPDTAGTKMKTFSFAVVP